MQRRHDGERDGDGDTVRRRRGHLRRQEGKPRLDQRGERRLADPAETEAGHRDPELGGGDVAVGLADGPPHGPRAAVSFGDQLIDARLADGDDRELRRDEESVGEHEREHAAQPPRDIPERVVHTRRPSGVTVTNAKTNAATAAGDRGRHSRGKLAMSFACRQPRAYGAPQGNAQVAEGLRFSIQETASCRTVAVGNSCCLDACRSRLRIRGSRGLRGFFRGSVRCRPRSGRSGVSNPPRKHEPSEFPWLVFAPSVAHAARLRRAAGPRSSGLTSSGLCSGSLTSAKSAKSADEAVTPIGRAAPPTADQERRAGSLDKSRTMRLC